MSTLEDIPDLEELTTLVSLRNVDLARAIDMANSIKFPEFVDAYTRQMMPVVYSDGAKYTVVENGKENVIFDNLLAVMDAYEDTNVYIDPIVAELSPVRDNGRSEIERIGTFFMMFPDDSGGGRILCSEGLDAESALLRYCEFLLAFRTWEENKTISTAFDFINKHPLFYRAKQQSEGSFAASQWEFNKGFSSLNIDMSEENEGESAGYTHTINTNDENHSVTHVHLWGAGYDDSYKWKVDDWNLHICEVSLDKAIMAYAEGLYAHYGLTEKPVTNQNDEGAE